ncbi:unnamed protein product [Microthlaspi erraticum]|uniref:Uncharacterized protein n=1 Tax=Microthlaspi erraticum TaxID=1685480 RepID=A0A6D2KYH6_9BRAS|nr:unnamed protein product [Microthlaspi erraticum]
MDFIKTSSLRALIELTFQRNWNGLIWMSRKGVIAKRVKTAPDGSIENQRPTAQTGWPRNECSALGQNHRPSEVSAKVQSADHASRPGKHSRGRPSHNRHATPRTTMPREPGTKPRGRATYSRTTADVRPSREDVPRPAEKHRPNSIPSDHRPTVKSSGHDRSDSATTRLSGRPSRPTVRTPRSTRSRF